MLAAIREVHQRMLANAEAMKRLLLAHDDPPPQLDAERQAHLQELLDEIGARAVLHAEMLNEWALREHLERRVQPFDRRIHPDRRQRPATQT